MLQIIDEEGCSLSVQCVDNPTGSGGVGVYDGYTYALPSVQNETDPTGLGEVVVCDGHNNALPSVQSETDPTGSGGVVVFDDHTYALPSSIERPTLLVLVKFRCEMIKLMCDLL